MTPFGVQVLVGIVAVASLVLGLYNLWYAKQAPVRERQRELEDQVRSELEALQRSYKDALSLDLSSR